MGGIAAGIFGVGIAIGHQVAAPRAGNVDLVASFGKGPIGVGQFGPPKTDRPARHRRNSRIGRDDQHGFRAMDINRCCHDDVLSMG